MASTDTKRYCTKCKEKKRSAVVVCNGCKNLFCGICIVEHRQDLVKQIDDINREHIHLKQVLNEKYDGNDLLSRINMWEQESIRRIEAAAESARIDLHEWIDREKNSVKPLFDKVTNELEWNEKSNSYSEMDLSRWIQQLKELKETIDDSLNVNIIDETDSESIIHLIKVKQSRNQQAPSTFAREQFDKTIGAAALSQDGFRASHLDHIGTNGSASGINLYSSGVHQIHFQVIGDWGRNFFSGIITSLQDIIPRVHETPSAYGWWDFDGPVINGAGAAYGTIDFISNDDQLTLTLNCDQRKIQLEHHRTKKRVHLSVDIDICPFPWKFVVGFDWRGGSIKILH